VEGDGEPGSSSMLLPQDQENISKPDDDEARILQDAIHSIVGDEELCEEEELSAAMIDLENVSGVLLL